MDGLKKLHLLFLEDNEEFAQNTKEFLEIYFKSVIHEKRVSDALNSLEEIHIDVIISDIKLNDENGLDFMSKVREFNKTIPIVVLSAHKDEEFLLKAIPLGIMAYKLKPIAYNDFLALLQNIDRLFTPQGIIQLSQNIFYKVKTHQIVNNSETIALTQTEYKFLDLLLKHEILTKEVIQRDIYEEKLMSSASLKNLLLRLRKKLGSNMIETLNKEGYRLISYPSPSL